MVNSTPKKARFVLLDGRLGKVVGRLAALLCEVIASYQSTASPHKFIPLFACPVVSDTFQQIPISFAIAQTTYTVANRDSSRRLCF
ncbi:MAG: hypothetical protein WA947_09600 [Phormidesmis sp.]